MKDFRGFVLSEVSLNEGERTMNFNNMHNKEISPYFSLTKFKV